jgi:hypothetical protein
MVAEIIAGITGLSIFFLGYYLGIKRTKEQLIKDA